MEDTVSEGLKDSQLTKAEAESMYCVVMPLADRNLFVALKQERFVAQEDLSDVKHIFTQLLKCADHMHSKGMLHGDLKTLNIVRIGGDWKLIDLDASCRLGKDCIDKYSSAYIPPEAVHVNKSKKVAFVRSKSVDNTLGITPLLAHSSYDIWSLGCM
eukprot:gene19694-25200_t